CRVSFHGRQTMTLNAQVNLAVVLVVPDTDLWISRLAAALRHRFSAPNPLGNLSIRQYAVESDCAGQQTHAAFEAMAACRRKDRRSRVAHRVPSLRQAAG